MSNHNASRFWNNARQVKAFSDDPPSEYVISAFSKLAHLGTPQKALDLGCGGGRNTVILAQLGYDVALD